MCFEIILVNSTKETNGILMDMVLNLQNGLEKKMVSQLYFSLFLRDEVYFCRLFKYFVSCPFNGAYLFLSLDFVKRHMMIII